MLRNQTSTVMKFRAPTRTQPSNRRAASRTPPAKNRKTRNRAKSTSKFVYNREGRCQAPATEMFVPGAVPPAAKKPKISPYEKHMKILMEKRNATKMEADATVDMLKPNLRDRFTMMRHLGAAAASMDTRVSKSKQGLVRSLHERRSLERRERQGNGQRGGLEKHQKSQKWENRGFGGAADSGVENGFGKDIREQRETRYSKYSQEVEPSRQKRHLNHSYPQNFSKHQKGRNGAQRPFRSQMVLPPEPQVNTRQLSLGLDSSQVEIQAQQTPDPKSYSGLGKALSKAPGICIRQSYDNNQLVTGCQSKNCFLVSLMSQSPKNPKNAKNVKERPPLLKCVTNRGLADRICLPKPSQSLNFVFYHLKTQNPAPCIRLINKCSTGCLCGLCGSPAPIEVIFTQNGASRPLGRLQITKNLFSTKIKVGGKRGQILYTVEGSQSQGGPCCSLGCQTSQRTRFSLWRGDRAVLYPKPILKDFSGSCGGQSSGLLSFPFPEEAGVEARLLLASCAVILDFLLFDEDSGCTGLFCGC